MGHCVESEMGDVDYEAMNRQNEALEAWREEAEFLDRAALAALTGYLANPRFTVASEGRARSDPIAESAWNLAEAMLLERKKRRASFAGATLTRKDVPPMTEAEKETIGRVEEWLRRVLGGGTTSGSSGGGDGPGKRLRSDRRTGA